MSNILILPLSSLILFQKNEQPGSNAITPLSSSLHLEYNNGGGLIIKNSSPSSIEDLRLGVEGNGGQLFSVNDTLTGNIFRINDISGLPLVQVYETGDIGINTLEFTPSNQPIAKVHVVGDVLIEGSLSANDLFIDNLKLDDAVLNSLSANQIFTNSLTAGKIKTDELYPLSVQSFDIFNANIRTYTGPLTATGEFIVFNINGKNRAIMLWDFDQPGEDLFMGTLI
jgi:hypothetical protein